MRILVVDDDAVFRDELAELLRDDGHTVGVAPSAAKALEWLEHEEADVVLTDLRMPRQSGLDLLRDIRTRWPRTLVVMITGFATIDTALEAMHAGAFDYLRKPFRIEQVRATLQLVAQERAYEAPREAIRDPWKEARELASEGQHEVLFVGDAPSKPPARVHVVPLDAASPSSLIGQADSFLADHPNGAIVISGVERLLADHRLEDVVGVLDQLRGRLGGHGPLRVGFDPTRITPSQAAALGAAVSAEEMHSALEALANPIRRKVLERTAEGPVSFSEAMAAAALDDSPKLAFHLRKLVDAGLLTHEGERYRLTSRGRAGVQLLVDAAFLPPLGSSGNLAFPGEARSGTGKPSHGRSTRSGD